MVFEKLSKIFCACLNAKNCNEQQKLDCVCRELNNLADEERCSSIEIGCFRLTPVLDDTEPTPNIIGAQVSVVPGCTQTIFGAIISVGESGFLNGIAVPNATDFSHYVIIPTPIPFEVGITMKAVANFKLPDGRICKRTIIENITSGS